MQIQAISSLEEVSSAEWNALVKDRNPFTDHAFLSAMERHDCVGEVTGWLPHHLLARDDNGALVGAMPLYIKYNSYGEFVFDWAWADAYRRNGKDYYPKFVSSIPFTPCTGQRLLLSPSAHAGTASALISAALHEARRLDVSSFHCLFPDEESLAALNSNQLMTRIGVQFHWQNQGYRDFQDFLDGFTSKKRKNVNRERRQVEQAGIEVVRMSGAEATESQWRTMHRFYSDTFNKRGGYPTLTLPFFLELAKTMGDRILLVFGKREGREMAGAISFLSDTALYGRHWGCDEDLDSLHFEACYYQGIEFAIARGLKLFEPGAQGEHKISRGFLPTLTWSSHWLQDPDFQHAVDNFLRRESPAMREYAVELGERSPYRQENAL